MSYVSQAEVVNIIKHNTEIREYELRLDKERSYNPGSFVQLTLDLVTASDIWPDSRTFSIASYKKGVMIFIIKNVGGYTNRIFDELNEGDKCTIKYPFGDLYNKNSVNEKHLFLAGGVGITPYLGLIEYFESIGKIDRVSLFYSVKHFEELLHYDKLNVILGSNLEIFITRETDIHFHNRRIGIDDISKVADIDTNIYICGSKSFNSEFKSLLQEKGYKKIHMDEWEQFFEGYGAWN